MAGPRKGHVGQPQVPIQLQATQRVAENVGQPQNPNSTRHGRNPHANASTPGRLAAQRFRAQRDAHLRADNLRHARAARRTRPDNTFLTYDSNRGGNSPLAVQQSGQQFLTLITKTTPCHGVEAGQATLLMTCMACALQSLADHPQSFAGNKPRHGCASVATCLPPPFSVIEFVTRAVFSTQIAAQHPPLEGGVCEVMQPPPWAWVGLLRGKPHAKVLARESALLFEDF